MYDQLGGDGFENDGHIPFSSEFDNMMVEVAVLKGGDFVVVEDVQGGLYYEAEFDKFIREGDRVSLDSDWANPIIFLKTGLASAPLHLAEVGLTMPLEEGKNGP